MATAFAALESRLNSAVLQRLSNAEATLPGGTVVPVIFDNGYAQGLGGMVETSQPSCQIASTEAAALVQGGVLAIGAVSYRVAEVHPDGTGITTLVLELA